MFMSAGVQTAANMNERSLISLSDIYATDTVLKEDRLKSLFFYLFDELKERTTLQTNKKKSALGSVFKGLNEDIKCVTKT